MSNQFARRLSEIAPFKVMKLLARAQELQAQGRDVIHMEVGEPDFPTPSPIINAGLAALRQGRTRYTSARGIPQLVDAIADHYLSRYRVQVDRRRIFVTAGGSGALTLLSALLLNEGEGLLMTDPGYPCNRHFIRAFHGEPQLVQVGADTNYHLTAEQVAANWQVNTRGVLLASPANPTGAVIGPDQLRALCDKVRERDGHIIMDEIYHGLTYDAGQHPDTVLSFDDNAFVINSFSKYFGMTGWRLGWLVVPEEAIEDIEKLAQNLFICPSSIAQYAALAAFGEDARAIMERQREEFAKRRDFLLPALRHLGFDIPVNPQGAFYVYAGLPPDLGSSEAFCDRLLEEYFVAVTPGTDFGVYKADQHVRFTYAESGDRLETAVQRLTQALTDLRQ